MSRKAAHTTHYFDVNKMQHLLTPINPTKTRHMTLFKEFLDPSIIGPSHYSLTVIHDLKDFGHDGY